jgi:hypothetical protein
MAPLTWQSPSFCGCILILDGSRAIEVVEQCAAHKSLAGKDALWNELQHLKGNAHRPDTCGCSVAYWWDDREADRVHTPVNHPEYTIRCEHHAHHEDHIAHHDAVVAENQAKNVAVNEVALALNMVPQGIPYHHETREDRSRAVIIHYDELGVHPSVIPEAARHGQRAAELQQQMDDALVSARHSKARHRVIAEFQPQIDAAHADRLVALSNAPSA